MSQVKNSDSVLTAKLVDTPSNFVRWEAWLERLAERLNPILIKESRQALKSKQFLVTFTLLLLCGWLWSLIGAVFSMPEIYYAATGSRMLTGYYCILAVPLLVVVPFSAFRSLASEREDGTYELLSITSLTSRQIVTGKLGSAIIQMIVYYSALAPCIVFTYLLRGVDIVSILVLLIGTFFASVLFSAVGIMFAGLSGSRNWQTLLTVALLATLGFSTWGWLALFSFEIVENMDNTPYGDPEFWIAVAAFMSAYVSYLVIVILVGAAQNSFASDNRSTKLRIAMLAQTILFAGWISWGWTMAPEWEVLVAVFFIACGHWYVYGIFLTGESQRLSPRVKRGLPVSTAGRTFLTWFNPGSGTGYVFTVTNLAVLMCCIHIAYFIKEQFGIPESQWARGFPAARGYETVTLTFAYLVLYLGIGRLVILMIPNRERYNFLLPLAIHALIAVASAGVPFSVQSFSERLAFAGYTRIQMPNWVWSLEQTFDAGLPVPELLWFVGAAASIVFIVNLIVTAREIEAVRLETPKRVKQDDLEIATDLKPTEA